MDALKGLTALQYLDLSGCPLTNVDGFGSLSVLKFLNLLECDKLKSVQELRMVGSLKVVALPKSITDEEIRKLQSHLPNLTIIKGDYFAYQQAVKVYRMIH